jgi:acyl dehydratase
MFNLPFDDLAPGLRFTTHGRTVTEADVMAFAGLTGDHHPQHTDARWAAKGPFGGRIAHGLLVLSAAAGLVPFDPDRVLALRKVRDVVFKRPVRLGDTITVEGRLGDLIPIDDDAGLVSVVLSVLGEDEKLVCRATVEVLWRRDGQPAALIEETGLVHAMTSVPL